MLGINVMITYEIKAIEKLLEIINENQVIYILNNKYIRLF